MVKTTKLKQRALFYIIFLSCFLLINSKCDKNEDCPDGSHRIINIKNNSNTPISWIKDDNPNDSIWTNNGSTYPNVTDNVISSNSNYKVAVGLEGCWEYYYQNGHSEYYFIFNNDTVQAIGWQAISGSNRGLLKRVKVNLNYLNGNNFIVTYP